MYPPLVVKYTVLFSILVFVVHTPPRLSNSLYIQRSRRDTVIPSSTRDSIQCLWTDFLRHGGSAGRHIGMAFCEDLELLQLLFQKVSNIPWDPVTALPLTVQCLYESVLDLLQKYRYTARDASAALEIPTVIENYSSYFTRRSTVHRVSDDFEKHGATAILVNIGDLLRVLYELDVQYESRMKRLAVEALISQPMTYDSKFRFRSKIAGFEATGPTLEFVKSLASIKTPLSCYHYKFRAWVPVKDRFSYNYDAKLSAYKYFTHGRHMQFDAEGTAYSWLQMTSISSCLQSFFNGSLFFGPTTRTTQMTCFIIKTGVRSSSPVTENEFVVRRYDEALTFSASLKYLPITRELQYVRSNEDPGLRLGVVCEKTSRDRRRIRVSLATSMRLEDSPYNVRVTKLEWVDAECMDSNRLRYSSCENGELELEDFPCNVGRWYKTWHVVMGNGCRLKIRVSNLRFFYLDANRMRKKYRDPNAKWTVTNTENHVGFAECASMLQRYYAFQARFGRVHPLETTSVKAFIAENESNIANLDWLDSAHLERPSATGTPPARYADPHTSRLIHAMVLKELTTKWCSSVEYPRLSSVSSS